MKAAPCVAWLLAAASALSPGGAAAACSVAAGELAFGEYRSFALAGRAAASPARGTAIVVVECRGLPSAGRYELALEGTRPGTARGRLMLDGRGGPPLGYAVYRDASLSGVWGDGTAGEVLRGTLPRGDSRRLHTVHAVVAPGQSTVRAGAYGDRLRVTLHWELD